MKKLKLTEDTHNHTPGPWVVMPIVFDNEGMPESVIGQKYGSLCVGVAVEISPYKPMERSANAYLMAAAPDLLDALETALSCLTSIDDEYASDARVKGMAALDRARGVYEN